MTVINASAAVTLLEQRPEKIQAPSGIRTHYLCNASAVLSQLSYQRISELSELSELSEPEFFQVSVQVVLRPHLH